MQKIVAVIVIVLSVIVSMTLLIALYTTYQIITSIGIDQINPQDLLLLPAIAISSGVLIAILTWIRGKSKLRVDQDRHTSEVMLDRVKDGFKTTIGLLSDKNNNRAIWIRASRTLLKTLELKEKIITEEYQVAYELEEERARNELSEILCIKDESTGEREPLPPQFFYGINDWETSQSLDEVAKKLTLKPIVSDSSIDKVDPTPKKEVLCVESVVAIFKFMEYPKDYNDPLDGVKVWVEDPREYFARNDQGARKYVLHRQEELSSPR